VHYIVVLVMARLTNVAPSSTTCDLNLNYIPKLTPSELYNSQQHKYFNSDSKDAQSTSLMKK